MNYASKNEYFAALFLLAFMGLLLMSCAPASQGKSGEHLLPEVDVLQMKENSDAALKLVQQTRMDIDAINTRLSELERMVADLNATMQTLPLARVEELQTQLTMVNEELQILKMQVENGAQIPTFHPKTVKKQSVRPTDAPASYISGLAQYDSKSFLDAIKHFEKTIASNPRGKFADDSQFWIGECHFRLGDYARAVASYQKVFSFMGTDKGDDAQYKIAMCYIKLGDRKRAVNELKKVEVLYPQSEYVQKAKIELRKMGAQ